MEKVAILTEEIEFEYFEPYTLRFGYKFLWSICMFQDFCFSMVQGAFLIYALGVVGGIAIFLFEIYVAHKKFKKESSIQNMTANAIVKHKARNDIGLVEIDI